MDAFLFAAIEEFTCGSMIVEQILEMEIPVAVNAIEAILVHHNGI